ncbi:MAG: Asp-tRNA(Asn)/Glu-tRNA(Gln) amidotransferase subunit GatC [Lactobacillaceae bacterium]|jgi:aspartyl-tRNA(Asn)/glutamyl-tRNA(Gln) amidotransferase subunit C|nr:Asp-tRNA(Asn)/Glu-tRNA(Gln) amidotransferase subunit GatC [Lactobacillaceae bacterium]
MKVDNETVKKIAFLSRLNVDEDFENTKNDFENILGLIEQFSEVDTKNAAPLVSVNDNNLICREDKVMEGGDAEKILSNAPAKEFGYFVVPKVVE